MATHRKLITLLSKGGFDEQTRHDLIYTFTKGRTRSTRDLTLTEVKALCSRMEGSFVFVKNIDAYTEIARKKKRSIVLKIATKTGIHDINDWSVFNGFMLRSSIYKKQLNAYKLEELDALIQQFRALESNFNRSARKVGTKAHSRKFNLPNIVLN